MPVCPPRDTLSSPGLNYSRVNLFLQTVFLNSSICSSLLNFSLWKALLPLPSRFSRVRLCATPWTAAYQASPSMGFSRQEHWSGLPFPSPMHQSGKWKWSHSLSHVWFLVTPWTVAYQAPPSMGFSRQEYWSTLKHCLLPWKALVEVKTIVCENKMQYGILHYKLKYYFLKFSVKVLKIKHLF